MSDTLLHERLTKAAGNLTFRELAEITGTNHETVRRYLQGQSPSVEFLSAFCEKLSVNGRWLLTGAGPMRAADIRSHSLSEMKASDLLGAMATTMDHLQDRVERIDLHVHTLEARLRGAAGVRAQTQGEKYAGSTTAGPSNTVDSAYARARSIADALPRPSRPGAR